VRIGHHVKDAKSGTIDQTREKFGRQNPVHDFMKIERP
jgi:hypothetical protein